MVRNKCITHPKNKLESIYTNLSVVLLSAGSYKNFKRSVCAIQLADGQTVVEKQINAIKTAYPLSDITVVVGHDSEYTIEYLLKNFPEIRIIHNERFDETNNSRSLDLAIMSGQRNNLLVINGDILFDSEYIKDIVDTSSVLVIDKTKQITDDEVGGIVVDGVLTSISHGLPNIWAQIVFLKDNELDIIKKNINEKKNHVKFLHEIINSSIDNGAIFLAHNQTHGYIKEIDNFKDLEKINENLM